MGMLAGVRVLDLSRILAGPWCTQLLADYGADVVKVERPGAGDDTRHWGPPFLEAANLEAANGERVAAYYLACNRGKRSVALDFSTTEGQALAQRLAAEADVLVENYLPGTLARYGLDYATLAARHPRLVYCSISGFGQHGANAARPGYDAMIQAEAGLMSLTGIGDGEPGAGPQKVGVAVSDLMCGMYAASAILAALHARAASGRGTHLDLALFDSQVAWLANQGMNYLVGGAVPERHGTAHPNIAPYQMFATADGHVMLAVGNDAQFRRWCEAAGQPLADDARFATNAARVTHRAALVERMQPLMRTRTTQAWLATLAAAGVPAGPVNDLAHVFAHEQTRERGLRFDLPHAVFGAVPQIGNPVRSDDAPLRAMRAPPGLGEHTDEVLASIGVSAEEVARLRGIGVVA